MRTIQTTLYKYSELSEKAQSKALEKLYDINVSDSFWYESIEEDAERVGFKIEGFDIDRGSYCKGKFTTSAREVADLIIKDHGESRPTRIDAETFLRERDTLINEAPRDESGEFENEHELDGKLDDLEEEFLKTICEDYLSILRKEYEYMTSQEAIKESILANDYEFTEDGNLN